MQIIKYPEWKEWNKLVERPYINNEKILDVVKGILAEVKLNGDKALKVFASRFDGVELEELQLTAAEIQAAAEGLPVELKNAILQAKQNIEIFHKSQIVPQEIIETMPGISCWRRSVGIEKVGLYIPGGSAPLFSTVLMLGVPAQLAGCKQVILCTPCQPDGNVHPAILFAASLVGIQAIYKTGGAQAIAGMAYGTETIPKVYKIFGPGNQYVTAAKQMIQQEGIAIDMPAGPSEVCVLADETANPRFIAADLLSQAEHGADSQVLLVTTSESLVNETLQAISEQLKDLPRKSIAEQALDASKAIVVESMEEALLLVNEYAAEHLIISTKNANAIAEKIVNAGSVFIGNYSPESVGDYASGTNHTLPTNGYARAYSGVSVDSFVKKITYQKLTQQGLAKIAPTVVAMSEAEGLQAHANAVKIRMNNK